MKINVAREGNRMVFTVEGVTLSQKEPKTSLMIGKKVGVVFVATNQGIQADVISNGALTKQEILRNGAGVEGWIISANKLEKDIQDVMEELTDGPMPGVNLDLLPNEEVEVVGFNPLQSNVKKIVLPGGRRLA